MILAPARQQAARIRAAVATILADPDTELELAVIPRQDGTRRTVHVGAYLSPAPRFGLAEYRIEAEERLELEIEADGPRLYWSEPAELATWDGATEPEDFDGSRSYRGPVDALSREEADRYLASDFEREPAASPWMRYLVDQLHTVLSESPRALRSALLSRS